MVRENKPYGQALISRYLPTLPARRYLNCCHVAGWHRCNARYHWAYPHGVPLVLVFYTVRGAGWLILDGARHLLLEGSIVVIPADTPMEYGTVAEGLGSWEFYWLNLEGTYVAETARKLREDGAFLHRCGNRAGYVQILRTLLNDTALNTQQEQLHSNLIRALFELYLEEQIFGITKQHPPIDPRGDEMISYLHTHYNQAISLETLCSRFYLSENQLIRVFRKRTGYTPYEYLKRYRLTKACELLEATELQIHEIARAVGYVNSSHFTAQFRMLYGITPNEYRRNFSPDR